MKRLLMFAAVLALLAVTSGAFAQTTTTSSTTTSSTTSLTMPQPAQRGYDSDRVLRLQLAKDYACLLPTCTSKKVRALAGRKTITTEIPTGTGTVVTKCRTHKNAASVDTLDTNSTAHKTVEVTQACEELWIEITACTSCTVNAFVMSDMGY